MRGILTPLLNVNMKIIEVEGDQRKHQDAVDKSLRKNRSELQMAVAFHCAKNWIHTPSASGSYGRPTVLHAGRQSDENV